MDTAENLDMKLSPKREISFISTPTAAPEQDGIFSVKDQDGVIEFSYRADFNLPDYVDARPREAHRLVKLAGMAKRWGSAGYMHRDAQLTEHTVTLTFKDEHKF